jgi:hypothetical protein
MPLRECHIEVFDKLSDIPERYPHFLVLILEIVRRQYFHQVLLKHFLLGRLHKQTTEELNQGFLRKLKEVAEYLTEQVEINHWLLVQEGT